VTALRVAVIGLGTIGLEHVARLCSRPRVRVVAVCDTSAVLGRAVVDRFRTGPSFTDAARMLDVARPDAVHVLTPPASHAPLAVQALDAGAHVLAEKPIAPTWDEYVAMRDAARENGRLLCENHNTRFARAAVAAEGVVASGRIGEVVGVEVVYSGVMPRGGPYFDREVPHFAHALPGGPLQNFLTHPLSLALPYIGEPDEIASTRLRRDPLATCDDELRLLLGGRRAHGIVTLSAHGEPQLTVTVRGTEGHLEADILTGRLLVTTGRAARAGLRRGVTELASATALIARRAGGLRDPYDGLAALIARFLAAAASEGQPPVTEREMDAVNGVMRDVFAGARA
jgi:predicted dehydrogenase